MNAPKQYDPKFISDKEVAALLAISAVTVCRRANLPAGVRLPENEIDLREAEPLYVGRCRRWRKDFILLLANHKPVPTDTWLNHHSPQQTAAPSAPLPQLSAGLPRQSVEKGHLEN